MTRNVIYLSVLIFLFLLTGCASTPSPTKPRIVIQVDSIRAEENDNRINYVLLPGNKDTSIDDLLFKEFTTYVKRALTLQGYKEATNFNDADVSIFLSYGIGDPQEHLYTYSLPVWGQTGISSSRATGTLNVFGNYGSYSETKKYTPSYGITGFTSNVGSYTTFFRFMFLDAYDLNQYKESMKLIPIWQTKVTSEGPSNDLRRVFPFLVAGSNNYIGKNTNGKMTIELYEDDQEVLIIKGIVKKLQKQDTTIKKPELILQQEKDK